MADSDAKTRRGPDPHRATLVALAILVKRMRAAQTGLSDLKTRRAYETVVDSRVAAILAAPRD